MFACMYLCADCDRAQRTPPRRIAPETPPGGGRRLDGRRRHSPRCCGSCEETGGRKLPFPTSTEKEVWQRVWFCFQMSPALPALHPKAAVTQAGITRLFLRRYPSTPPPRSPSGGSPYIHPWQVCLTPSGQVPCEQLGNHDNQNEIHYDVNTSLASQLSQVCQSYPVGNSNLHWGSGDPLWGFNLEVKETWHFTTKK